MFGLLWKRSNQLLANPSNLAGSILAPEHNATTKALKSRMRSTGTPVILLNCSGSANANLEHLPSLVVPPPGLGRQRSWPNAVLNSLATAIF